MELTMHSNWKRKIFLFCTINLITSVHLVNAALQSCHNAPLIVMAKTVGSVTYSAHDCQENWETQDIRLDFAYHHDIPEWAFKRAATHYLEKNIANFSDRSPLNSITELYRPVKKGDLYSLNYKQNTKTLTLFLNQKSLGSITDHSANQYFKIWFGSVPFNAKLKQQLLHQ